MTVITRMRLEEGTEPEWDEAMKDRMSTAESVDGWVAGQILIPLDALNERLIVGVWNTRADWEAWHNDPTFQETRERLADMNADDGTTAWHEVVYDARRSE